MQWHKIAVAHKLVTGIKYHHIYQSEVTWQINVV